MLSITATELKEKLAAKADIVLIDVREPFEHEDYNIGGTLIPMNTLMEQIEKIPTNKTVVLYCAKGIRSTIVIQRLEEKYGYSNLINLSGGMGAWKKLTGE
jgi:adenylyltransferase/sulfurtransferase